MDLAADDSVPLAYHSVLLAELALATAETEDPAQTVASRYTAAQERHRDAERAVEAATRTLKLARDELRLAERALERIRVLHEQHDGAQIIKSSVEARIEFAQERLRLYTREQDVLSLAGSLPGEIVTQIFDHTGANRASNAIRLSHVNRRWRNLALSTPSFWANLDSLYEPGAAHVFAARAGQLPLNVFMIYGPDLPSYDRPYDKFSAFVAVAAHYGHRWSRIHIGACSRYSFKSAFTCITDALEDSGATLPLSVASVSLQIIPGSASGDYSARDKLGFESAWPFQAREVILSGLPRVPAACLVPGLLRLELRDGPITNERFDMAMLLKAPNLEMLVVDMYNQMSFLERKADTEIMHTMPCLQTLRTNGLYPADIVCLMFRIRMPALRHVDLTLTGTCADVLVAIKVAMRGTPIEDLRIRRTMHLEAFGDNQPFSPHIETFVANITPSLPMLTRLSLENVQLDDGALKGLTAAMPRLDTLHLSMEENITVDGLRDIVLERFQSNATAIQCLQIVCSPHFNDAGDWADILELVPQVIWFNDDEEEEHADQEDAEASDAESETDSEIDAVLDEEEKAFIGC
ncbi:hypothetical protein EXIGLDRAFT_736519 [Exidia glandulosa HHB12029]|uniref:F-box domain-containing protein n=1 Tax=Exidia glandulosa HHB12029 TaxID=1314781 RepID=A0A165JC72_EXIGL|nr:hypothetical protein EXIGLDRAFT_736519 [Exidia glandulosa HHB12029]